MGSILNDDDLASIRGRMSALSSTDAPRWGRMDAGAMLAHLRLSALMALGELPVACKGKRVFQVFPVKHLLLHVVPFPRSAPTVPELLPPGGGDVDALVVEVLSLMDRIAAGPREGDGPVHPLFGRLSYREWGVATYKHVDHHLRQFGAV